LVFHGNNGCMNTSQCYGTRTLPVLLLTAPILLKGNTHKISVLQEKQEDGSTLHTAKLQEAWYPPAIPVILKVEFVDFLHITELKDSLRITHCSSKWQLGASDVIRHVSVLFDHHQGSIENITKVIQFVFYWLLHNSLALCM